MMSGPHGVQRRRRIDQCLAFLHRRGGDGHVHDIGAEAFARQFEGGLCAGGGFKKEIDLRATTKRRQLLFDLATDVDRLLRKIEQRRNIVGCRPSMPSKWR
jgi:hypothetical protein